MGRRLFRGDAYSENGWPFVDTASCTWVRIPGAEHVSLQIQNGPPLQVIRAFAADYHAYVEPLRDPDSACWTPDNTVRRSNHPAGTGADLNWLGPEGARVFRYGIDKARAFPGAMARELDLLYDFYEGNMFCGGYWGIRDWMHHQLGPGTYDQKADRPTAKIIDFIERKIRPDGFSTYRRGGTTAPPVNANAVNVLMRATGVSSDKATAILPGITAGLRDSQCTNVNRIAMWLAQTGHESGSFVYTEEIASGAAYEGRADLGNTQPGDGVRFKGRSWIQITGRHNYTALSKWAHGKGIVPSPTFFVDDSRRLAEIRYAGTGPAWYWTVARPDINALSDAGDIVAVTQRINGGQNGIGDRRERYRRALNVGDALLVLLNSSTPVDPWEALLMSDPVESWSIYATPGEPKIPPINLLRAIDAAVHRDLTDADALAGDPEAIRRVARTALGQGVNKSPGAVAHATRILNQIPPAYIDAANPGKQA